MNLITPYRTKSCYNCGGSVRPLATLFWFYPDEDGGRYGHFCDLHYDQVLAGPNTFKTHRELAAAMVQRKLLHA